MNATTQPTGGAPERTPSELNIRELVDALANGSCDSEVFLRSMRDRIQLDPTGNWEVLSQLDQYYRRGRISPELFQEIRSGLAEFALGLHTDDIPLLRPSVRPAPTTPPPPPQTQAPTAPAVPRDATPETPRSPAPEEPREIRVGDVLRNRYRIVGVLGQGGMGTVYEADDNFRLDIPPTGQGLAIKVLHTSVTQRADLFSELRREFQYLQSLAHPNIVRAFEFDRDGALAFFTMELLNGSLLSRVLMARNRVRLDRGDAWAVVRDVGSAIAHAHSRNIVHGDINPQNIFLTLRGNVRVLDFGASHSLPALGATEESTGASFATPGYVSPQVLEGERPDARDDIFALACVTYLLLSGEHPFMNRTATEARARGIKPKRPIELHGRQWRALRAGLNWDREKRPAEIGAWLHALDVSGASARVRALSELTDHPEPPRRNYGFAVAVTAAVLATAAAGIWIALHFASLSNRLANMVDKTSAIRSPAPETLPPTTDFTPPPNLSGLKSPRPSPRPAEPSPAPTRDTSPAVASPRATPPPVAAPPASSTEVAAAQAIPRTASPPATAPQAAAPPVMAASKTTPSRPAAAHTSGTQIELGADAVDVPFNEPSASVLVRRKGSLAGRVGFTWWTESGTAKPVVDFAAAMPHQEFFEDGQGSLTLSIRLTETLRTQDKSFYVVIDQPSEGATLGARALTMITLPGNHSSR